MNKLVLKATVLGGMKSEIKSIINGNFIIIDLFND